MPRRNYTNGHKQRRKHKTRAYKKDLSKTWTQKLFRELNPPPKKKANPKRKP